MPSLKSIKWTDPINLVSPDAFQCYMPECTNYNNPLAKFQR